METVSIKTLADEVGLEPKLVRRIIRKSFKRGPAESGKYILNPDSDFYRNIKTACEEFKGAQEKKEIKKPKGVSPRPHSDDVKMDDRGFSIIDGKVWAVTAHGGSVCLGSKDDVLPYIEGKTHMKPVYKNPACDEALLKIMTGESSVPPAPDAKSPKRPKTAKRKQKRSRG